MTTISIDRIEDLEEYFEDLDEEPVFEALKRKPKKGPRKAFRLPKDPAERKEFILSIL